MTDRSTTARTVVVLSAGAVEPGLIAAAEAFARQDGDRVELNWATTPTIRKRVAAGEVFDLLIVPAAAAADLASAGKVAVSEQVQLGRVGVGVAVRTGAPVPDVTGVAAFERSLLQAESIIFTLATSGIYVESMLKRQGLYERLLARITRFATGPEMMDHLIHGSGREVCMGAIVEIMMFRDQGVQLVAPLPPELQHFTAYHAVPMTSAGNAAGARAFLHYLGSAAARAMFSACGVDVGGR